MVLRTRTDWHRPGVRPWGRSVEVVEDLAGTIPGGGIGVEVRAVDGNDAERQPGWLLEHDPVLDAIGDNCAEGYEAGYFGLHIVGLYVEMDASRSTDPLETHSDTSGSW